MKPALTIPIADVAAALELGEGTVKEAIRHGDLPGYQIGARGQYVIPRPAWEAFLSGTWEPSPREYKRIKPATEPIELAKRRTA